MTEKNQDGCNVNVAKSIMDKIAEYKKSLEFWVDSAKLDFAIRLEQARVDSGTYEIELNKLIDKMGNKITYDDVMRGKSDITLEEMVYLSRFLGYNVKIKLEKQ